MRLPAALGLLLLMAACHSTVRTETRYLPPTDPAQLACVDACYKSDQSCLTGSAPESVSTAPVPTEAEATAARQEYDQCSRRVQAEYEQCQAGAGTGGGRRNSCYRPVCVLKGNVASMANAAHSDNGNGNGDNDSAGCTRMFNACFVHCGGRIESRELCEGRC